MWIMGKLTMVKNWLIAAGVFALGCFAFLIVGRRKQYVSDNQKVTEVVNHELERISNVGKKVQDDVSKLPPAGPDSADQRLQDDWSER